MLRLASEVAMERIYSDLCGRGWFSGLDRGVL